MKLGKYLASWTRAVTEVLEVFEVWSVPLMYTRPIVWSLPWFLLRERNEVWCLNVGGAAGCGLGTGAVDAVSWGTGVHVEPGQKKITQQSICVTVIMRYTSPTTDSYPVTVRKSWNSTCNKGRKAVRQKGQLVFRLESSAVQPAIISSSYTRASQERHWEQLDISTW